LRSSPLKPEKLLLEKTCDRHLPVLLPLFRDSESLHFSSHPYPNSIQDLDRYLFGPRFLISYVALNPENRITGFIGLKKYPEDTELPLLSFQLAPTFRKQGNSKHLLHAFFQEHPGAPAMQLGAYVRVGHISSFKTLQRFDFRLEKTLNWGGSPWWFFQKNDGLGQITL
jgi:RimJ/RimL family protein N-acetyltransferase